MPSMVTSYTKSLAVAGTAGMLPNPFLLTSTWKFPDKPPGIPHSIWVSVIVTTLISYILPVEFVKWISMALASVPNPEPVMVMTALRTGEALAGEIEVIWAPVAAAL